MLTTCHTDIMSAMYTSKKIQGHPKLLIMSSTHVLMLIWGLILKLHLFKVNVTLTTWCQCDFTISVLISMKCQEKIAQLLQWYNITFNILSCKPISTLLRHFYKYYHMMSVWHKDRNHAWSDLSFLNIQFKHFFTKQVCTKQLFMR